MTPVSVQQQNNQLRLLPGLLVLSAVCFLFAFYSIRLTVPGNNLAPLWFPTSVMAIAFYHCPLRRWPVIALCATCAILLACSTLIPLLAENVWLTFINVAEAMISASLLRRWLPAANPLASLGQWARMVLCSGIIAPLTGAILTFSLTAQVFSWPIFSLWILSESIPALALIPVGLLYRRNYFSVPGNKALMVESLLTLLVTLTLSTLALLWLPWPFAFIIVLLMWSAIRLPRLAAFLVFLSTLLIVSSMMALLPGQIAFTDPHPSQTTSWLPFLLILLPANVMSIVMYAFRSERKRIADSEDRFRSAMEYSAIGMALISTEGRWMQVNRALCRFLGYPPERLQELTFQEITWPEDLDADLMQFERLARNEIQSFSVEKRYVTGQGSVVWGRMSASVVRHHDRSPNYYITQIEDITELKLSEKTNQRLMERITLANEAGGIGIWEWDLISNTLSWDKRMFEIYQIAWTEQPSYANWRKRVVSEDRPQVEEAINNALKAQLPLELEFRIRVDCGIRYIRSLARRVKDPARKVDRLLGINMDMTEVKRLNEALFQEKERLHITLNSIGEAVICIDEHQQITFMNPVAEKLMGWRQEEALNQKLLTVVAITDGINGPAIESITASEPDLQVFEQDMVLHSRQGTCYDIHYSITPLKASTGVEKGLVMVIHDVSESRKMLRQLSYSASHDSLTNLPNRASFENALRRLVGNVNDRQHALVFIDLDRFKAVNDSAGHAAGDALLREVASLMQHQIRPADTLARLGGDEFGLLLPDCDIHSARAIAERIVNAILHYQLAWEGKYHSIGASAGITCIDSRNRVASEVLSQADIACYKSKHAGRGKVSVYDQQQPAGLAEMPSIDARLAVICQAPLMFNVWPVVYTAVPETTCFWLIEPDITGFNSDEKIRPGLISEADRQALDQARDQRIINHFFAHYAAKIATRGIGIALPVALSTLCHQESHAALMARLSSSTLPPRLLHLVLYGDTTLSDPRVAASLEPLKALGCVIIYNHASRDLDIFNVLPRHTLDYLLLDPELTGNLGSNLMDEMMVTILHGHAQRLNIRTLAGSAHSTQSMEILTAIGVNMLYGEAVGSMRPLDNLLDGVLFGIH